MTCVVRWARSMGDSDNFSASSTVAFGCVADDDTGATDTAGMLAERNVKTLVVIDVPSPDKLLQYSRGFEAVVIACLSRFADPSLAAATTTAAFKALKVLKPRIYQFKYCSTFDSTERGNIGPCVDAAMDILNVRWTIVVPAQPRLGRTTYMGHHFVGEKLLCDSHMKDHPLNPMRDSDLVRFLGLQTPRRVGLATLTAVRSGPQTLKAEFKRLHADGHQLIVVDAVESADLTTIARATQDQPLVTGGSGISEAVIGLLLEQGHIPRRESLHPSVPPSRGAEGVLVIAGSCSPRTREQNAYAKEHGFESITVEAESLVQSKQICQQAVDQVVAHAVDSITKGKNVLVYCSSDPDAVGLVYRAAQQAGLKDNAVGPTISQALGTMAKTVIDKTRVNKLIVAGGETAGYVCRALQLEALEVGKPIDPGVPCCFSLGRDGLILALKSGNFGSVDFYARAAEIMKQYSSSATQ